MPRSHRDTENLGILGKRFPLEVALGLGPDDWKSRLFGCLRLLVAILAWLLLFTNGVAQGSPQQPTTSSLSSNELVHAQALINQGKLDEAITLLDELNHRQPGTPGLEAKLGKAYYQKRSFQQAVTHFKAALQQDPDDGETVQLLGLSFYSLGQLDHAIPLLERVQSRLPPTDIDTAYLLGVCYLKTQQLEKARAAFARMFSVLPGSTTAHLLFAQMMVRQHLEEKAIPELEKAIALDPRFPMVHFLLGEIYLFKSNPQVALEEFQKELQINPSVWLVYWRLGDAYARLEKYGEAERALKQAIWLNETFTGPYVLLGQIGLKKGDLELAVGFLERALKMDPNNYYAHYFLGQAYQKLGRNAEANREVELSRTLRTDKKKADEEVLLPAP